MTFENNVSPTNMNNDNQAPHYEEEIVEVYFRCDHLAIRLEMMDLGYCGSSGQRV